MNSVQSLDVDNTSIKLSFKKNRERKNKILFGKYRKHKDQNKSTT